MSSVDTLYFLSVSKLTKILLQYFQDITQILSSITGTTLKSPVWDLMQLSGITKEQFCFETMNN